jgi:uncharacterized damage-inducible protein DinB
MTSVEIALGQLRRVRRYTCRLLDRTDSADWFNQPAEGVSHLAWQVGHLASSQYRLALERIRGKQPEDERLISQRVMASFVRETVPNPDPLANPSPEHLRQVFDRVHRQVMHELQALTDEELLERPLMPHPLFDTKLGSLLWCAQHEMLHAGQIGLLRRLLGYKPLW